MTPFHKTACRVLQGRASDYVMWCAGHGADATTIQGYLSSLSVFPSHFHVWARRLSRSQILEAIPVLARFLPGSTGTAVAESVARIPTPAVGPPPEEPAVSLPPVVATVVTLAIQHHILHGANPFWADLRTIEQAIAYPDLLTFSLGGTPK